MFNYKINNNSTIIFISSANEKEKLIDALCDIGLSYLIDDSYRDRVIARKVFSHKDIESLETYLDPNLDDIEPSLFFDNEYIGEKFQFEKASYHGMMLSLFM